MTREEKIQIVGILVLESAERVHEANKWTGQRTAYMTHPLTVGEHHYEVTVQEVPRDH